MPQLDTSTFASQLFWLVVCFLALYFILSYIALPKISKVLETREQTIEGKINKASLYREQAEDLLNEYEATLAKAREEAHLYYKSSASAISADIALKEKDILDKLSNRLHLAEQTLYRSRVDAGQEMGSIAEEIANLILDKITNPRKKGV
jgi:F-type H+-transporting ATPase subunit b